MCPYVSVCVGTGCPLLHWDVCSQASDIATRIAAVESEARELESALRSHKAEESRLAKVGGACEREFFWGSKH